MSETEAAVVAFQGICNQMGDINRYIYHWIVENYIPPGNESNPENYVTEICCPIKK